MRYQRKTPKAVIKAMCLNIGNTHRVLEPSAGDGDICKYIINKGAEVHAFELNSEKRLQLKKDGITVLGADFLAYAPTDNYDRIVMCPPFKYNLDIVHVMHAYKYLKTGGTLRALMNPSFFTENRGHQIRFREFLENKSYSIKILPDNTFIEKGKTVPTILIIIKK